MCVRRLLGGLLRNVGLHDIDRKLVEFIFSAAIACLALSEIVITLIKIHGRFILNFGVAVELFILLSSACNSVH